MEVVSLQLFFELFFFWIICEIPVVSAAPYTVLVCDEANNCDDYCTNEKMKNHEGHVQVRKVGVSSIKSHIRPCSRRARSCGERSSPVMFLS